MIYKNYRQAIIITLIIKFKDVLRKETILDKLLHNMTIIIVDGGCRSPIVTKRFNLSD